MKKQSSGFTLIELMIVVAILGILLTIAVGRYHELIAKSNEGATRGNMGTLRSTLNVYYGDNQQYPYDDLSSLLVSSRYLVEIPTVKLKHLHNSELNTVTGEATPTETTGWSYNNVEDDLGWGRIVVGCLHSDLRGASWTSY